MSKNAEGWIRHRGGKCPVEAGVMVDVRNRSGDIYTGRVDCDSVSWHWSHDQHGGDIMAYRLHKPAEQGVNMDAFSECVNALGDSHADVMESVLSRIEWRDRITTIDFDIHALTTERAELVQKLAGEGFALIGRINDLLTDAAQKHEDMSDWRNWKKGDLIECTGKSGGYSPGSIYTVKSINHDRGVVHTVTDDSGSITNGWGGNMFIWKYRPSA